jgi:hypothetical protein
MHEDTECRLVWRRVYCSRLASGEFIPSQVSSQSAFANVSSLKQTLIVYFWFIVETA